MEGGSRSRRAQVEALASDVSRPWRFRQETTTDSVHGAEPTSLHLRLLPCAVDPTTRRPATSLVTSVRQPLAAARSTSGRVPSPPQVCPPSRRASPGRAADGRAGRWLMPVRVPKN